MILIACDKFKGTLDAGTANGIISRALRDLGISEEIVTLPMSDGGEGLAEALDAVPTGAGKSVYILPQTGDALLASSDYCGRLQYGVYGVSILDRSSYALGVAIRNAVAHGSGFGHCYVGVGGTMTADGGAGMLQALGFGFLTRSHRLVDRPVTPRILLDDVVAVRYPDECCAGILRTRLTALSDVSASLVSPPLSALDFIAQKGADADEGECVGRALVRLRDLTGGGESLIDGAGGGIGYALASVIGAETLSGAEFVIARRVAPLTGIRLIITGEGCIDSQTSGGKVVDALNRFGIRRGIPVLSVGGCVKGNPSYRYVVATAPYVSGNVLPTAKEAADNLRKAILDMRGFFRTFVG